MRFTGKIAATLAVGGAALLTAVEKARDSFAKAHEASLPKPPTPDLATLAGWIASFNDPVALAIALPAVVTTGYSVWQMFKPDPPTKREIEEIVRKPAEEIKRNVDEVGGQVFLADQASEARDDKLMAELQTVKAILLAQNPGAAQQIEGFVDTATDLSESSDAGDRKIARQAVEGDPLEAADELLAKVEADVADAATRARQAARIAAPFSVTKAISAYARSVDLDPSDFNTWIELARLHSAAGSLPDARRTAEAALQHVRGEWDRMIAENTLGDIAVAEGQLPVARDHYQAGLIASQAVLAEAPDDAARQRDLSVSHNKLGDVAVAQGDLAAARAAYGEGLGIAEQLARSDPGNAGWQRDLSVSHNKVGDVAVAQGDLAAARAAYGEGLAIAERLARSDPGNAGWQRDLSVSYNKLGDVAVAQGDLAAAHAAYGESLAIRERLAGSDPGNAGWQRDLVVSHAKLAQLAEAAGDVAEALAAFGRAEAILVALIERVGRHPQFERDLAQVRGEIARLRGE